MSRTFERIQALVARQEIRISEHGYDELAADDILVDDIISGVDWFGRRGLPRLPQGPMYACFTMGCTTETDTCCVGNPQKRVDFGGLGDRI
jgi:hypothetical protein